MSGLAARSVWKNKERNGDRIFHVFLQKLPLIRLLFVTKLVTGADFAAKSTVPNFI